MFELQYIFTGLEGNRSISKAAKILACVDLQHGICRSDAASKFLSARKTYWFFEELPTFTYAAIFISLSSDYQTYNVNCVRNMSVPNLVVRAASAAASATSSATASAASSASSSDDNGRPPVFKAVGIILAVSSGLLIGSSFVLKKVGLLRANVKYNEEAGEGYGYLKNLYWWAGMTLMALGELCNFVAYAFVDAILVTPMGALSVVVTTILSAIFLKERLSFVGKVGCVNCIIGSVVIAMNAPAQSSVSNIDEMQHYVIAPGFLSYAGVIVVGCAFVALWAGPRYGKRSMFVYISICSLIGGLSVVATQGLGAAIVAQIQGHEQFKHWFLYVLLVFVIMTLVTEIIYLNVSETPEICVKHRPLMLDPVSESVEYIQCCPSNSNLLCVLH